MKKYLFWDVPSSEQLLEQIGKKEFHTWILRHELMGFSIRNMRNYGLAVEFSVHSIPAE